MSSQTQGDDRAGPEARSVTTCRRRSRRSRPPTSASPCSSRTSATDPAARPRRRRRVRCHVAASVAGLSCRGRTGRSGRDCTTRGVRTPWPSPRRHDTDLADCRPGSPPSPRSPAIGRAGRRTRWRCARRTSASGRSYTWDRVWNDVLDAAHALLALGVEPGDRVSIHSEDRPEWVILDLATVAVRGITVGLYPTNPAAEVDYLLGDSGATVHLAEDQEQVDKVFASPDAGAGAEAIVYLEPRGLAAYDDDRLIVVGRLPRARPPAPRRQPGCRRAADGRGDGRRRRSRSCTRRARPARPRGRC